MERLDDGLTVLWCRHSQKLWPYNNTGTPETLTSVQALQIIGSRNDNCAAGERNDVTHGQSLVWIISEAVSLPVPGSRRERNAGDFLPDN